MTYAVTRFGMNLLLCSLAIPAIAAQSEQTPPPSAAAPPAGATHAPQNTFQVLGGEQANQMAQRMKERLTDPEQRAVLRAEQRAAVVSQNVGVGRVVGLDPAGEQKLIELLTDQQMERLEQMYVQPRPNIPDLQQYADETTQRMNALSELLGEEKLERFQVFETNQSGRYWVSQVSAWLAPADKLQPDQEDRLAALKQEQFQKSSAASGSWRASRPPIGQTISMEERQRDSQRKTLLLNENSWRERQVENRALEQKAASFLTSAQLAGLSKYQAQEQDSRRRYVESARAQAGLDPKIPAQPEVVAGTPKLIEAQVEVEVKLTVNRELTTVKRTVRSGDSFTFEAAQGLIVEATPMMYEDDWIDVHLKYYEMGSSGRRRLAGGSIAVIQARQANSSPANGGSSGSVIAGRKGYAVESTINAKVL